jgi:hypothetical protein
LLAALAAAGLLLAACAGSAGVSSGTAVNTVAVSTAPAAAGPAATHASSSAGPGSSATTARHTFAPYDASGQLTAAVVGAHRQGTCWTTSIAVPIAGVYRCFADNEILDPCFAPAVETTPVTLACFADPWHPGTLLTVRGSLPKDDPQLTDGHPWALQLANGARCVDITGVVPTVDGTAVEYVCGSGRVAGIADTAAGAVTARYGTMHGPLHAEQIRAEWRGRSYRIGPTD